MMPVAPPGPHIGPGLPVHIQVTVPRTVTLPLSGSLSRRSNSPTLA